MGTGQRRDGTLHRAATLTVRAKDYFLFVNSYKVEFEKKAVRMCRVFRQGLPETAGTGKYLDDTGWVARMEVVKQPDILHIPGFILS